MTLYLRDYGHVDHGYAATVHKAQKMTVDWEHVLASRMLDRHGAYVTLRRRTEQRDDVTGLVAIRRVVAVSSDGQIALGA